MLGFVLLYVDDDLRGKGGVCSLMFEFWLCFWEILLEFLGYIFWNVGIGVLWSWYFWGLIGVFVMFFLVELEFIELVKVVRYWEFWDGNVGGVVW